MHALDAGLDARDDARRGRRASAHLARIHAAEIAAAGRHGRRGENCGASSARVQVLEGVGFTGADAGGRDGARMASQGVNGRRIRCLRSIWTRW